MKISIIYYSLSGNTKIVAEIIANGTKISNEVDVKTMDIDHVDNEFVFWGEPEASERKDPSSYS